MAYKIFDRMSGTLSNEWADRTLCLSQATKQNVEYTRECDPKGDWCGHRWIVLPFGDAAREEKGIVKFRLQLMMRYMAGDIPWETFVALFDVTQKEIDEAQQS